MGGVPRKEGGQVDGEGGRGSIFGTNPVQCLLQEAHSSSRNHFQRSSIN